MRGTPGFGLIRRKARKAGRRCALLQVTEDRGAAAPRSPISHAVGGRRGEARSVCPDPGTGGRRRPSASCARPGPSSRWPSSSPIWRKPRPRRFRAAAARAAGAAARAPVPIDGSLNEWCTKGPMEQAVPRPLVTSLPNVLTYARILAVPALVGCLTLLTGDLARWSALVLFVAAALTDWLDGYLARVWEQQSALGRMLDPIADKLIVGAALIMLVHDDTIDGWSIWAAVVILCREILVSGLREFLAELNVKVHVTQLAKWKTAMQMVALP